MNCKLVFMESFESNFKDKKYVISSFIEPKTLLVLNGSNLKTEKPLIKGELYDCKIDLKGGKLKVISVES